MWGEITVRQNVFIIQLTIFNAPLLTMSLLKRLGQSKGVKIRKNTVKCSWEVVTLLDVVCKNTDKIYQKFGLDLDIFQLFILWSI